MKKHSLEPLTDREKQFAEDNHDLVYSFLKRHRYSIEEYYNVVIFGYLKAVQVYLRIKDLQQYDFHIVAWQYMRSEMGNHHRAENCSKRKPEQPTASLDANYTEDTNLYNSVADVSADVAILAFELEEDLEKVLSDKQKDILQLKVKGYSNKEVYLILKLKPSSYYNELKKIKSVVEGILF